MTEKEGRKLQTATVANFDVLTASCGLRETVWELPVITMSDDDTDDGEVHLALIYFITEELSNHSMSL